MELPAAAPRIARNIFGLPLFAWTVRTSGARAGRALCRPDDL
jgi:glycerophosphoryl diester phosphodiesterase